MKAGWRYISKAIGNDAYECWFKGQQRIERHGYRANGRIRWVTPYNSFNGSEFIDCTDQLESAMDSFEVPVSTNDC